MTPNPFDVFINCPFDEQYKPLFESIVFTITACNYNARCALEVENGLDIRYDRLCRLIDECRHSVHDRSRTELSFSDLPRFNMPFELGLTMGAKRFGGRQRRDDSALIMVAEKYRLPAYLSDLGGNDPLAHKREPEEVVKIVRKYLHAGPDGIPAPGAANILGRLARFKRELPAIASGLNLETSELDIIADYRTFVHALVWFVKNTAPIPPEGR